MKPIMGRKKCLEGLKNEDSDHAVQTKNRDQCFSMVSEETDRCMRTELSLNSPDDLRDESHPPQYSYFPAQPFL